MWVYLWDTTLVNGGWGWGEWIDEDNMIANSCSSADYCTQAKSCTVCFTPPYTWRYRVCTYSTSKYKYAWNCTSYYNNINICQNWCPMFTRTYYGVTTCRWNDNVYMWDQVFLRGWICACASTYSCHSDTTCGWSMAQIQVFTLWRKLS